MANTCRICQKPMDQGGGCSPTHVEGKDGKTYERIRHTGPDNCGDCSVAPGQFHHEHCDIEVCPICRGQMYSCDCWKGYCNVMYKLTPPPGPLPLHNPYDADGGPPPVKLVLELVPGAHATRRFHIVGYSKGVKAGCVIAQYGDVSSACRGYQDFIIKYGLEKKGKRK